MLFNYDMKQKRAIYLLLFLVSMVMLVMPVIPHHHHAKGVICLKGDLSSEQQCPIHHQNEDACCDSGCMAHFDSSTPNAQTDSVHPQYVFVTTLFTNYLIETLLQPLESCIDRDAAYLERLHGANVLRVFGLRAPPCVVA